ncbi:hypothetical protein MED297_09206 [Reinekea sp. MED297]|uniref:Uncharacterized protein n=1 Tax=Reinekea blandensis MED297 TaxID=314283 RepID=A4BHQ1_9GAMM|nr:hypothetical protein MED297_09206 [Reinekea sp. MED297] [Reinekea blandensis MED297]
MWVITLLKGEPYELSLQYIKENTQVAEMIGQSIEPGWPVLGSITNSGTAGHSDIYYAIRGDVSKATVHVKASKHLNEWQLDEVIVTPTDGQAMVQTFH